MNFKCNKGGLKMFNNVDDAINQFCYNYGYDPREIQTHQFKVWYRNGQYWATEPTIIEPDAEKIQVRIEPGTDEWGVV
jgi:hypothetical protein